MSLFSDVLLITAARATVIAFKIYDCRPLKNFNDNFQVGNKLLLEQVCTSQYEIKIEVCINGF